MSELKEIRCPKCCKIFIGFIVSIALAGCGESPVKRAQLDDAVTTADMRLSKGDIQSAYNIYCNVIENTSNKKMLAHVYSNRGMALMQASKFDEAKDDFSKACGLGNKQGCRYLERLQSH